jgi:acetolactate synthase-1/2/3 large subunit
MTTIGLGTAFLDRPPTVAHLIVESLYKRGVRRIYGLTGGHIKPIWDEAHIAGIEIISTRHEAAAVHMAQAHADLTGELAIATVTCGPGFTNALSGIVAADIGRSPVLVLTGLAPSPQRGMRGFEDLDQVAISRPATRYSNTIDTPRHTLWKLDDAIAAAEGMDGRRGVALLDIPIDVLRSEVPHTCRDARLFESRQHQHPLPDRQQIAAAAVLLKQCRRPLVISGRSAFGAGATVQRFLDESRALYLDTKESRGLIPANFDRYVSALRGRTMAECDLVVTLGTQFNYELGYGSTALFRADPKCIRIGQSSDELYETRRPDIAIQGDIDAVLIALLEAGGRPEIIDDRWIDELCGINAAKKNALVARCEVQPPGDDGRIHPLRLLGAVNQFINDDTIITVDGGDILSFARIALKTPSYMDPGPFGCLGAGVPYAVAAASIFPDRRVLAVVGDGAFGFNAMEVETAVRIGARVVVIIANNGAWGIERNDQIHNFGGRIVGTEIAGCRYDLLAKGLGAHGEHVENAADLPEAIARAIGNAPAVIDVATTRDAISPDFQSGLAELPEYQALRSWNEAEISRLKE